MYMYAHVHVMYVQIYIVCVLVLYMYMYMYEATIVYSFIYLSVCQHDFGGKEIDALEFGLMSDRDSHAKVFSITNPNPVQVSGVPIN